MTEGMQQMEQLAEKLGEREFDLMLAGDGSGTTADKACGFACFAYDRGAQDVRVHRAAFSHGTNNFAELMPYVHALWHFHATCGAYADGPVLVLVVSDSELTVRQGQRVYARNCNGCLWAAVDWFENNGYRFSWRHVRRNTNPVHTACDGLAGRARKDFSALIDSAIMRS